VEISYQFLATFFAKTVERKSIELDGYAFIRDIVPRVHSLSKKTVAKKRHQTNISGKSTAKLKFYLNFI